MYLNFHEALQLLKVKYYSSTSRKRSLQKGEVLMKQGDENRRLYLVKEGALRAMFHNEAGEVVELFQTKKDMFVGVYSFFSKTYRSFTTIEAMENTEVGYIEPEHVEHLSNYELEFLPVMINELKERQKMTQKTALDKEKTLKQLLHTDKMASLGQLAAGLAHELNNAVGVLQRQTQWLSQQLEQYLEEKESEECFRLFSHGLERGQFLDSASVRKQRKVFTEKWKLEPDKARKLARTGLDEKECVQLAKSDADLNQLGYFWDLGLAFHDMLLAAKHAVHVVKSVKQLGVSDPAAQEGLDLNNSIKETISLLNSPLRQVKLHLDLKPLPGITANHGEFVQVWLNIIKNGIEAMIGAKTPLPQLWVTSEEKEKFIQVTITDNGPGIPKEIQERIFQPSFTTKVGGLSFGLGLGLSIVQRIINDYNGKIEVSSQPSKTAFTIRIPV